MMNLTHDWFYKGFISVKVFLNNFSYFAILSCSFTSKTKNKAFCGINASAFEFKNEMEHTFILGQSRPNPWSEFSLL